VADSPLLLNALESLEHALDHYLLNTPRDRKFAILHADQAVELILKEKVRSMGVSIYRKDGKTSIGLQESRDMLTKKQVAIPEINNLEMLHDERNKIQHLNSSPDAKLTDFYIEQAVKFMMRFLTQDLGLDLNKILTATSYARFETFIIANANP